MLKVSLAGCGGIANVHAKVIDSAKDKEIRFISCCDEKFDRALSVSDKYGCKPFASLKELVDFEKPDILHITTPHYSHVPLSLYALRKGIHVLLEKPAASTPGDIPILIDAVKSSGKQLGVCFQNRYNPASQYARQLLNANNDSGKILGARAFVTWRRPVTYYTENDWRGSVNTEGASVLINQSIHTVDLLQWLLGEPVKISGSVSNHSHKGIINTEDTAEAHILHKNGASSLFYASVGFCMDADISIDVICENLSFTITRDKIRVVHKDGTADEPSFENNEFVGKAYWGSGHEALITDFYSHIADGTPFPIDVTEGCLALSTCFKIIESSNKKVAVAF